MEIEVLKFGGTATSTKKNRDFITNIIKKKNNKTLVIASAMGRIGFPYATDTLLNLIDENIDSKEKNRLLATGEIISTIVLSNHLKQNNIKAYALSLKEVGIYENKVCVDTMLELFKKYDVLIAPGFLYLNELGEVMTMKRGGGDLSAVLLAEALKVDEVILYKDVLGIMPFNFPGFKQIKHFRYLSYDEALAINSLGYNAIQKEAIERAKNKKIVIVVRSFLTEEEGTIISTKASEKDYLALAVSKNSLLVATNDKDYTKIQLEELFNSNRLYYKDLMTKDYYLEYSFGVNQLQVAKKKVIETLFKEYL